MKKYLLLVLISLSTVAHTQVNKIITTMSPTDRHNLFLSTKEVADAYNSLGRTKKANSFYRLAIAIYPIGDKSHQLANQFEIPLDDEETYTNFVLYGDTNFQNQQYKTALYSYLMADELDNSPVLYQKIANTYEALENPEDAAFYQELGKNANSETPTEDFSEPMTEETPTDYTYMDLPTYEDAPIYEEGFDVEPIYEETMTPDTQNVENIDLDSTNDVMTIDAENILSERALSKENSLNVDDINDIMQIDYEEQLN